MCICSFGTFVINKFTCRDVIIICHNVCRVHVAIIMQSILPVSGYIPNGLWFAHH